MLKKYQYELLSAILRANASFLRMHNVDGARSGLNRQFISTLVLGGFVARSFVG